MKRKLIISVSVLIILIAGYIAVSNLPEKKVDGKRQSFKLLEGFETVSADIENSYGKYSLEYNDPDWTMNGEKVKSEYITRLSGIRSDLKLNSSEPGIFGLDIPSAKITLKDKDGAVKVLLIGDPAPDKSGRYVMTDGIYVVPSEYVDWLIGDKKILKTREFFSAVSLKKVEFNGICFEITDGIWQMTSPYQHQVKGDILKTELLDKLRFTTVDFTDKSPEDCGLKPPRGYISVWNTDDEKTTVYFGDTEGGLIYAMPENGKEISLIDIPGFLDKKPIYFLNTLCYVKNIDEIKEIKVNGILFEISDGSFKKNRKKIEKKDFIEFYKELMGMTLIDEAIDPVKDKLLLKMEINFKDRKNDTVEVYQYKERYGAVFINGKCTFYTLGESAEKIASRAQIL